MFETDRKKAIGCGSAREGTHHFWAMTLSSVALLFLVPLFIFTFGQVLGSSYEEVRAYYSNPFPVLIGVLTLVVGFYHFNAGARVMIEDYTKGLIRKTLIIFCTLVSYALMAIGVIALLSMLF